MSTDGRAIANFVLDRCEEKGRGVGNLALQKIVYFCHVWSLIRLGRPLVKQQFEAWQYGPVLQYLYREFKNFKDRPINSRSCRINADTGQKEIVPYRLDPETADLLEGVVDFYSRLRLSDLIALSHVRGGPWDIVWNHPGAVNPGMRIEDEAIKEFYSKVRLPFSVQ